MKQLACSLLVLTASLLGGCTYSVHQASVGGLDELPAGARVRAIEANGSENFVLGLGGDTAYVDAAWKELQDQCAKGEIVGVESRHSTSLNFLSSDDHIKLTGLCYEAAKQPAETPPPPLPQQPSVDAAQASGGVHVPSSGPVVSVE